MKSCVCLDIYVVYRFFKGGLAVWWKKKWKKKEIENVMNEFQKLKMHDLLVSFSKWHFLTLFKKKKYVQNTSYNTQILRAFRFFWWKTSELLCQRSIHWKTQQMYWCSKTYRVYKVFLFASTKYFYGFLLSGLNVFICILRGNFVFLFVRYSFCALQNTVACISALFHIFTASQVC